MYVCACVLCVGVENKIYHTDNIITQTYSSTATRFHSYCILNNDTSHSKTLQHRDTKDAWWLLKTIEDDQLYVK